MLLAIGSANREAATRAIESVCRQAGVSIELIVVDDSGDDDLAAVLERLHASDTRITILRHARAFGLPALSWIEAARRARGASLVLACEEDAFDDDALAALVTAQRGHPDTIVFGYADTVVIDPASGEPLRELPGERTQPTAMLRVENFIARHAVLIPRAAIDVAGFVDPHVLLADVAPWDLWRRLADYYSLTAVDVAVGTVHPSRADRALDVDLWSVEEWMLTRRDAALNLAQIGGYDVVAPNPQHGRATRDACVAAARQRGLGDTVPAGESIEAASDEEGYLLVVMLRYDASVSLYFESLPPPAGRRVRMVPGDAPAYLEALGRASAVVLVRALQPFNIWIDAARAVGVPVYYFLDDNIPLLASIGETGRFDEQMSEASMKAALRPMAGMLLSCPKLIDYFRDRNWHDNLQLFPAALANQPAARARAAFGARPRESIGASAGPPEIAVAFVGGLSRSVAFWQVLLPALERLPQLGLRIHLLAPCLGSDSETLKRLPAALRVTLVPWNIDFTHVIHQFARHAPDFMLVAPHESPNNPYETRHPLLTAMLLDAVAVLPRLAPYLDVADRSFALMVDEPFEVEAWHAVLSRAIADRAGCDALRASNRVYCEDAFSGQQNDAVLRGIMRAAGGVPSLRRQYLRATTLLADRSSGAGKVVPPSTYAALRRNADELLTWRRKHRFAWRNRILARASDQWDGFAAPFFALQRDALRYGWRRRGSSLELSDSIHDKPYYEYVLQLPAMTIGGVAIALFSDGLRQGTFTVSMIAPDGSVAVAVTRDLAKLDFSRPVEFDFRPVRIVAGQAWRLRLSTRSPAPVYVYEFVNRRGMGTFYAPSSPFVALLPAPESALNDRAREGLPSIGASGKRHVRVKLIVEGDIPTNQIISRLMREALGPDGSVETVMLGDFVPSSALDTDVIIYSRTGSPSAVPMIDWLTMHRIPYLYYIDDNFWEMRGDSPVALYYQCAPVRWALRRVIRNSERVIVNSPLLGDYIRQMFPRKPVVQLNAPFDFSLIRRVTLREKRAGEVRIGFAGNITRAPDFADVVPAFQRLLMNHPQVSMFFFGYCPPELIDCERVHYIETVADYAAFIALKASYGLDIGVAPMAASTSNLYKTNNKYREYGGLKIAGIYTRSSPYVESVIDGKTGLLVEHNATAWYDALERLVIDAPLRQRITDAAHADVRARYSQSVVAEHWRELLFEVANLRPTTASKLPGVLTIAAMKVRQFASRTALRVLIRVHRVRALITRLIRGAGKVA